MTAREWLPLAGIAVSAFVFNTSEFMPVGLLTDIGSAFGASEGQTGLIVSVYAWAVMLLSLPLALFASRFDFRRLVLAVVATFCAGQLLSAAAASYGMLMAARLVVACAHALFWALASPAAVRVVGERHAPLALSVVVTGSALAMIAGLPLGRVVGLVLGWRLAFFCVGAVSLCILVYLAAVFPRVGGARTFGLRELPGLFANKALIGIFALTALFSVGYYTGYSYIEPFFLQIGGLGEGAVTLALVVFGVAGVAGSLLYSRLYARYRFRYLGLVVGGVMLSLLMLRFGAGSPVGALLVCALWGAASSGYNVALQSEVIACTSAGEQTVSMAIFSGIFNFGIGTGTLLGGVVCAYVGIGYVGFAGAAIGAAALAYLVLVAAGRLRTRASL